MTTASDGDGQAAGVGAGAGAQLVGSSAVVSTVVDPVGAAVVTASLLLAQRGAPVQGGFAEWMDTYTSTLQRLGWTPTSSRTEEGPVRPDPGTGPPAVGTPWTRLREQLAAELPSGILDDVAALVHSLSTLDEPAAGRWASETLFSSSAITVLVVATQTEQTLDLVVTGTWLTYAHPSAPRITGYPTTPVRTEGSTLAVQQTGFEMSRAQALSRRPQLAPLVVDALPSVVPLTLRPA